MELSPSQLTTLDLIPNRNRPASRDSRQVHRLQTFPTPCPHAIYRSVIDFVYSFFNPSFANATPKSTPKMFFGFCKACFRDERSVCDPFYGLVQFHFSYFCSKCKSTNVVLESSPVYAHDSVGRAECLSCKTIDEPLVVSDCPFHKAHLVPLR